jgi:hypothetical protein
MYAMFVASALMLLTCVAGNRGKPSTSVASISSNLLLSSARYYGQHYEFGNGVHEVWVPDVSGVFGAAANKEAAVAEAAEQLYTVLARQGAPFPLASTSRIVVLKARSMLDELEPDLDGLTVVPGGTVSVCAGDYTPKTLTDIAQMRQLYKGVHDAEVAIDAGCWVYTPSQESYSAEGVQIPPDGARETERAR